MSKFQTDWLTTHPRCWSSRSCSCDCGECSEAASDDSSAPHSCKPSRAPPERKRGRMQVGQMFPKNVLPIVQMKGIISHTHTHKCNPRLMNVVVLCPHNIFDWLKLMKVWPGQPGRGGQWDLAHATRHLAVRGCSISISIRQNQSASINKKNQSAPGSPWM